MDRKDVKTNTSEKSKSEIVFEKPDIENEEFSKTYGFEHWPNECCQDCY